LQKVLSAEFWTRLKMVCDMLMQEPKNL